MSAIVHTTGEQVKESCARIGKDSLLVQGAGGNVSWKDADILWVKASGTWLAEAEDKEIFIPVNLYALRQAIANKNFHAIPKVIGDSKLRPSIETLLHALMPHKVVVHLHAIDVLVYLVRESLESDIAEKLKLLKHWALVIYQKPGEDLARAATEALKNVPGANILLLQNHGVVIGGKDVAEVELRFKQLLSKLRSQSWHNLENTVIPKSISIDKKKKYLPVDIFGIHNLAINPYFFSRVKNDWALYPDHVVFLGPKAYCYDSVRLLNEYLIDNLAPELIFIEGQGVFAVPGFSVTKQIQLKCYFDVIVRQSVDINLRTIDEQQIDQLLNWDAEYYRRQVAK